MPYDPIGSLISANRRIDRNLETKLFTFPLICRLLQLLITADHNFEDRTIFRLAIAIVKLGLEACLAARLNQLHLLRLSGYSYPFHATISRIQHFKFQSCVLDNLAFFWNASGEFTD